MRGSLKFRPNVGAYICASSMYIILNYVYLKFIEQLKKLNTTVKVCLHT